MKNNKQPLLILALTLTCFLSMASCSKWMVDEKDPENYEENFKFIWNKFDTHYGLFLAKNINWNTIHTSYLPLAENAKTDIEFYEVLSSMLGNLNDCHVNLYPTNNPILPPYNSGYQGPIPTQDDFLFSNVKNNYLTEYHEISEAFQYGILPQNIGYIHISSFTKSLSDFKKGMDKALLKLADTEGIIFDIRDHEGGDDRVSKYIAGRFATSKNLFMTSKKRNGSAHNDFDDNLYWYVEKEGDTQYTKPVILLTTRHSISAAETFTLAMKENSNIVHMGDTTAGAFF